MDSTKDTGPRAEFMMGSYAMAEGAIAAGCRFYAGYPITPATEVAEHMSSRMPEVGGTFIQMEDEIASVATVLGALWAGAKAFTATSGPGFTLMQEHVSHAVHMEIPLVIANIQRLGPGGGDIQEAHSDIMQTRWGSHGADYQVIALHASTCQEMFDLTIEAFNLAGTYRVPTFVLSDGLLGHMYELVRVPGAEQLKEIVKEWRSPSGDPEKYISFSHEDPDTGEIVIPPLPRMGTPYHPWQAISTTRDEKGKTLSGDLVANYKLIRILNEKILRNKEKILRWDARMMDDAEFAVISYGLTARTCWAAVKQARAAGIKVGFLRLITMWPFPDTIIREVTRQTKAVLVPEMNYGQVAAMVKGIAAESDCRVIQYNQCGLPEPAVIYRQIEEMVK